jgi:hypothetical protein
MKEQTTEREREKGKTWSESQHGIRMIRRSDLLIKFFRAAPGFPAGLCLIDSDPTRRDEKRGRRGSERETKTSNEEIEYLRTLLLRHVRRERRHGLTIIILET